MSQKTSTSIPFVKLHGAGNDFILVESVHLGGLDPGEFAVSSCDRNYGIGSDGLIIVGPSLAADLKMSFFNPDGTRDVCGNGMRCVALYRYLQNPFTTLKLEIDNGIILIEALHDGGLFKVQMKVIEEPRQFTLKTISGIFSGSYINTGTPHFVIKSNAIDSLGMEVLGAELEHHPDLPDSVSVDFVQCISPAHAKIRIWERSVGETLACGTAACAVVASGIQDGSLTSPCTIESRGGSLTVSCDDNGLYLTGPAALVFRGEFIYSKFHQ